MRLFELLENIITERYEYIDVALEKYKDDPDIFITYSDIPKLGINPQTSFKTPAGIYCYPLLKMYDAVKTNTVPFADDRKFVIVFRYTGSSKVLDIANYSESDYNSDINKLKKSIIPKLPIQIADIDKFIEFSKKDSKKNIPSGWIWNTTRLLSVEIEKKTNQLRTVAWGKILRTGLGYTGATDKFGIGIIHAGEPTQAVFFSISDIKLEEIIINKNRDPVKALELYLRNDYPKTKKPPKEKLQIAAIKQDGNAIYYIVDEGIKLSEPVQLAAVTENGEAIKHIIKAKIKPSEPVQLAAVTQNPFVIEYIINAKIKPSEPVQLAAVTEYGGAIEDIIDAGIEPSEPVQLAAVTEYGGAIKYIIKANLNADNPEFMEKLKKIAGVK